MINNVSFCLSTTSDHGAGQLYNSYYYTTLHNGNYITLTYVVHTSNGCGTYEGGNFQDCNNFMNNYSNLVEIPIQNSVATLKFTK